MSDEEIVLHFELVEGRYPDTAIVGQALIDWVNLAKAAAAAINPFETLEIEIAGVAPGSVRFPQKLQFIEEAISDVSAAWEDVPLIKKMVIGSAHTLLGATAGALVTQGLEPKSITVDLSEQDRAAMQDMISSVRESDNVRNAREKFYGTIEPEGAISGVGVADNWNDYPAIIVPRREFPEHSGLWSGGIESSSERISDDVWDVVLLRASFESKPRSWRFSRDGLNFSAVMQDHDFLQAVKEGRVPINLQEGVMMKIQIQYRERQTGQIWEAIDDTRKVTKVFTPAPSP